eukprot:3838874-Amphidinium_carterae.1
MVLNGAMSVDKWKDGRLCQRFISILTPVNDYFGEVLGDDKLLPYIGQITCMALETDSVVVVDSEDFESCFNLFVLPDEWLPFTAYSQMVPGWCLGMPEVEFMRPAMRVIPMGFKGSVGIVQSVVRELVFGRAHVEKATEVQKRVPLPDLSEGASLLYLDSFDFLKQVPELDEALKVEGSPEHRRFVALCSELHLPLNAGKRLIQVTAASLQGGLLDGSL